MTDSDSFEDIRKTFKEMNATFATMNKAFDVCLESFIVLTDKLEGLLKQEKQR